MTTIYENQVQELYIAYFGRAADPAGLAFYADSLSVSATTIEAIASSFANSTEAQSIVALSTTEFLTVMYQQSFAREYDTALDGTFWADAIDSGATTKSLAMVQILQGAPEGSQDADAVANKVNVASVFTAAVEAGEKKYAGSEVATLAKALLEGVTPDENTVTEGLAQVSSIVSTMPNLDGSPIADEIAPTEIALSSSTVSENITGSVIGTLAATDADETTTLNGQHSYEVNDTRFEVINNELQLTQETSLDFEVTNTVDIIVTATDGGGLTTSQGFTISVTDINEAPTEIVLTSNTVAENSAGEVIGILSAVDVDSEATTNGQHSYGIDDLRFEVVNGELKLTDETSLDFETENSIDLTITATDGGGLETSQIIAIGIIDSTDIFFSIT